MKKLFSILLAGILSVGLFTGCTKTDTQVNYKPIVNQIENKLEVMTEEQIDLAFKLDLIETYIPVYTAHNYSEFLNPFEYDFMDGKLKLDMNDDQLFEDYTEAVNERIEYAEQNILAYVAIKYDSQTKLAQIAVNDFSIIKDLYDAYFEFIVGPIGVSNSAVANVVREQINKTIEGYTIQGTIPYENLWNAIEVVNNYNVNLKLVSDNKEDEVIKDTKPNVAQPVLEGDTTPVNTTYTGFKYFVDVVETLNSTEHTHIGSIGEMLIEYWGGVTPYEGDEGAFSMAPNNNLDIYVDVNDDTYKLDYIQYTMLGIDETLDGFISEFGDFDIVEEYDDTTRYAFNFVDSEYAVIADFYPDGTVGNICLQWVGYEQ